MADNYIIVEGGVVQNVPALPVLDLDVFDDESPDDSTLSEVEELRQNASTLGLGWLVAQCNEWIFSYTKGKDYARWTVTFSFDVWGDRDPREWDWTSILSEAVGEDPDRVVENSLHLTKAQPT